MKVSLDKVSRVMFWGLVSFFLAAFLRLLTHGDFFLAFLGIWIITSSSYLFVSNLSVSANGKAVLITGCDSGFGHALALQLDTLGFKVFAGCLNAESQGKGAETLRRMASKRLEVLQLDVTNEGQIKAALEHIKQRFSRQGLWGVVSNAGISTYGAVEWVPMKTFRKLADVNIFGTIAVTKAFLPLVRRAKGRVVVVGSVEGRLTYPLVAPYDLTKHALEGFTDSLRHEMRRFGVKVCLIEPGNFTAGTSLNTEAMVQSTADTLWANMDDELKMAYGKDYFEYIVHSKMNIVNTGSVDLSTAVDAMTEALMQRFPQCRYQPSGLYIYIMVFVAQHFPEWIYSMLFIEP